MHSSFTESFQLTEREKKLQEERRRQLEKKKVEEAEKARIRAQVKSFVK